MEKVKVFCSNCETMIGFFEKGALVFQGRKTCFTCIENNTQTVKCRKCSALTTFEIDRGILAVKDNTKLRSRLLINAKSNLNK